MERTAVMACTAKWNTRTVSAFILLMVLPNMLGMLNIATPWGFKWHLFPAAIFAAAALFGPVGGLMSGLAGSAYSALIMSNPYLLVGNALLGLFAGLFMRKGVPTVLAVWLAFAVELPWLIVSDYYLVHLPASFIQTLVMGLFISNTVWALVTQAGTSTLRRWVK
jgi:uncharacterized membrane protein